MDKVSLRGLSCNNAGMSDLNDIQADYRVLGESKWMPFFRWLVPKVATLVAWAVTFTVLFVIIYTLRYLRGDFS